ncbi:hypothetical protein AFL42_11565 [Oceanobacillus caeni]|uniref:Transcobalamin-like C-terminal domain-containing protein n=1 Tax=Oceanobacillus caeni TaxID=405946 RepID=A0ABR5MI43_9BACI|nr:hypothetical protein WH51_07355 [Bacilli bacterium VT-13-104]KPH73847.1 hypothetical protein AFL42_11565 [Oceanobacillus caeni]
MLKEVTKVGKHTLVLATFFILIIFAGCSENNENNVTTKTSNSTHSEEVADDLVRITISKNNGKEHITEEEIPIKGGENLLELMQNNFFTEQVNGQVTSIERQKANEEENLLWVIMVNNEPLTVQPAEYNVQSGDKIIFDLHEVK